MVSSHSHSCWEAPTFHFNSVNQSEDWRVFYTRALDYLDTLNIEPDHADDNCKGWKKIKLMFEGEDRQAIHTLTDKSTITSEDMKTLKAALDATATTIKSEEHIWAYRDELISVRQQPSKGIYVLSQCICDLVTKSKFTHHLQEMVKIMVLQHAVHYHKARDWIRHQDQSQLTYQALLSHSKLLESCCEQYQKARKRGHANLISITSATASSIHADALTVSPHNCCNKCGYSHPHTKCQAQGQQCYTCSSYNHFTALCRQQRYKQTGSKQTPKQGNPPKCSVSQHHREDNPAIPLTGTATAATPIAPPGSLPTAPLAAPPRACHPGALSDLIAMPLHTGTPRTLYR